MLVFESNCVHFLRLLQTALLHQKLEDQLWYVCFIIFSIIITIISLYLIFMLHLLHSSIFLIQGFCGAGKFPALFSVVEIDAVSYVHGKLLNICAINRS